MRSYLRSISFTEMAKKGSVPYLTRGWTEKEDDYGEPKYVGTVPKNKNVKENKGGRMQKAAEPGTALVIHGGEVRLSPDLIRLSNKFWPVVDEETKEIQLHVKKNGLTGPARKVYFTNKRAKSGRISLGKEIRKLGFDPQDLCGVQFPAKVNWEGSITISMRGV
jgi:hypothetical protein